MLEYARTERARFVGELKEFVRFPSVSAEPERAPDVRKCAEWLAAHDAPPGSSTCGSRRRLAIRSFMPIGCMPPDCPTLLIYGHFDVQPADPLEAWQSPPFEPTVHGENLHGRGASDDKGQMFTHVKAIESVLRTAGALPVNVKCLFEGEEEIGSPHLPEFLQRYAGALAADVAVLSDNRMLGPDRPVLTELLRGGLSIELEVRGQGHDLHSGNFGGAGAQSIAGAVRL